MTTITNGQATAELNIIQPPVFNNFLASKNADFSLLALNPSKNKGFLTATCPVFFLVSASEFLAFFLHFSSSNYKKITLYLNEKNLICL
jgi:hypothetical protein